MGKISIHLSKLLKQTYSSRKLQTTVRKFDGRHTDLPCSQIWHFCVTYVEGFVRKLWHMTGSQLLFLNKSWRVPHVRRKWSLLPQHLISLPLGSSRFYPLMIYTLQNLSVVGLCLRINDSGLFACISQTALSQTYIIRSTGPIAVARRRSVGRSVGLSVCLSVCPSTPLTRQPMFGLFSKLVGIFLGWISLDVFFIFKKFQFLNF